MLAPDEGEGAGHAVEGRTRPELGGGVAGRGAEGWKGAPGESPTA